MRVVSIALEEVAEVAEAVDVGELEISAAYLVLVGPGSLLLHALGSSRYYRVLFQESCGGLLRLRLPLSVGTGRITSQIVILSLFYINPAVFCE